MIVQSASLGQGSLVIQQQEHARLALRIAQIWGNDTFAPLHPRSLMEFVVEHHDDGWNAVDPKLGRNADTGLPYNLIQTPFHYLMETGPGGPTLAETHHPYCGLLVSMHTYGLYNGRFGMSDKIFVNMISADKKPVAMAMLDTERARQERLRVQLQADPAFSALVEDEALFHNYKLLQFFDTLSLYFNMTHEAARGDSTFLNVPVQVGEDTQVEIRRIEKGVYGLSPYPFQRDPITVYFEGQRISPQESDEALAGAMKNTPLEVETIRFVSMEQ